MPTITATLSDTRLDDTGLDDTGLDDTRLDAAPATTELLIAAGEGDQSAWNEITLRYGGLVSATVRSFRLQDADALDAIQMTWLRLMTNWRQVRDADRLGAWLATTARRECLSILRQSRRTSYHAVETLSTVADPAAGTEQRLFAAVTVRAVHGLVAELPLRWRTLLRALFSDSPQPYAEIARTTGIPVGSIGPTRARALRQLRQLLDERGLGPEAI